MEIRARAAAARLRARCLNPKGSKGNDLASSDRPTWPGSPGSQHQIHVLHGDGPQQHLVAEHLAPVSTGKDDFALFQLPQLPLDGDVVPAGDGLENSIPRWPPAGLIEPKGSTVSC